MRVLIETIVYKCRKGQIALAQTYEKTPKRHRSKCTYSAWNEFVLHERTLRWHDPRENTGNTRGQTQTLFDDSGLWPSQSKICCKDNKEEEE